jgi:hypothetical protein
MLHDMSDADRISELEAALKAARTTIAWLVTESGGEVRLSGDALTRVMLSRDLELATFDSPDGRTRTIVCQSAKHPKTVDGASEVSRMKVF